MRWLSILVVALALVAAGCGGSDGESTAADETTVEETVTEETTTDETTTTEDAGTDTNADFNFANEDCQSLVAAFVAVGSAFSSAAGGSDEFAAQAEAFAAFADDVPEEIRADVETLAAAYGKYVEVVQDAGIQPGQPPTAEQAQQLSEALASVGTADVSAASERLGTWTNENCS